MTNTWVELDRPTLARNIRSLRTNLSPESDVLFVVKANAYGHGMLPVARTAWQTGIRRFAVAHMDEALALRALLPRAGILVLSPIDPSEVVSAAARRIECVVVDPTHGRRLATEASRRRVYLRTHAKIDTGMGRLGFAWQTAASELARLRACSSLEWTGICTHFASSDDLASDFAEKQAGRFAQVLADCAALQLRIPFRHASNSGAILRNKAWDFDAVRPGILLYGYARLQNRAAGIRERHVPCAPFLQWKTRVLQVKKVPRGFAVSYDRTWRAKSPTQIATINAGYADGYFRSLSNKGVVLIGGRRCPIAGRVTMNLIAVDVGPHARVKPADEAVLIGTQGRTRIWADELATLAGTISYEVLTNIRTTDRRVI